jgi:polyisoprenyl-phosphate glycosyltransferase
MMNKNTSQRIAIVVPCFNEEESIAKFVQTTQSAIKKVSGVIFEIICINDGSTDGTLEIIRSDKSVRYIDLGYNQGHQAALKAGVDEAYLSNYDAVVCLDADLQHPPEQIPKMVAEWRTGYMLVQMLRDDSSSDLSYFKRVTSDSYYKLFSWLSGNDMQPGSSDFRLIDRSLAEKVFKIQAPLVQRGYFSSFKGPKTAISYTPAKRYAGTGKYTFKKMLNLAYSGVLENSVKPLRLAIAASLLLAASSMAILAWVVVDKVIGDGQTAGWASLIALILILFSANFMVLGIIGEYIAMIFRSTSQRGVAYTISSKSR